MTAAAIDTQAAKADGRRVPLPHPLRQMIKDGLVALSLANLCFISAWYPLLERADFGYAHKWSATRLTFLALLANVSGLALLVWLIMRALRRFERRWLRLICDLCFLALLLLPLEFCRVAIFDIADSRALTVLGHPAVVLGVLALLAGVAWKHRFMARAAGVALGLLSPLALFTLARTLLLLLGLAHAAQPAGEPVRPPTRAVAVGQPRVLWIIFDETDQRLVFDQRPPGLRLPEFDRLRRESLYASNAYAPGDSTILSMPALISGQRIAAASIRNASDLTVTLADSGDVRAWSQLPSVFSSAHDLGVNTALVGWAHPYGRVLGAGLNYCAWHPIPMFEPAQGSTLAATLLGQLGGLAGTLHLRQVYVDICRTTFAESLSVVTNATYGLVLLHLPPPHKPGIYRPDKDQFTIYGMPKAEGYFNNLALADRFLGKLRRALERAGLWDKTWLLLSADHSWRESRLYDGRRDLRVPFVLRAPGQAKSMVYSPQINTLLTHDLILAILRGEVTGPENAPAWLEAHPSAQPTVLNRTAEQW